MVVAITIQKNLKKQQRWLARACEAEDPNNTCNKESRKPKTAIVKFAFWWMILVEQEAFHVTFDVVIPSICK